MVDTNSYPNYFPAQKIPTFKKTKQWYINCINAAENLALSLGYEEHRKMEVWLNLYKDVIDQEEIERVFNPLGLDSSSFPATIAS